MPLAHPLLVPAIRLDLDAEKETRLARARAAQPWVAGFLLFGGDVPQVTALTAELRARAGRPLFIASDMERGAGQQVAGLPRLPDLGLLGLAGTEADAHAHGELTARAARAVGVDVVYGPCLDVRSEVDNPILGNRSFGFDPWRVAKLGAAWIAGAHAGGALAVGKHFPGHGGTREDSHDAIPTVHADRASLEQGDLVPFEHAVRHGACRALMTAHVTYPALDPAGTIASFSPSIVARARALGEVLVFTDALCMAGATVEGGEPEAARRSLVAGCDMLLYPEAPEEVAAALDADPADVARACAHLEAFQAALAALPAEPDAPTDALEARMDALAERALRLARPAGRAPGAPDLLVLVDDDAMEDRGAVLAAAAQARGIPVVRLAVPEAPSLALPGDARAAVVVFAQARAWKGASGVSPACAALVEAIRSALAAEGGTAEVAWLAPRPEDLAELHLPGTGPQVEAALAAYWLGGDSA